jgi:Fe-S-cluster containining protein
MLSGPLAENMEMSEAVQQLVMSVIDMEVPAQRHGLALVRSGKASPLEHQVRLFRRMDEALQMLANKGATTDCTAGCSYCCHYHVYVTAPEAMALAEYVVKLPPAQQDQVRQRLRANVQRTSEMGVQEHIRTNVACAFLDEGAGTCTAYALRPSACRKHHSLDKQVCKATFENPQSDDRNALNAVLTAVGEAFMTAATASQDAEGVDFRLYEMSAAVLEALENPAARKRWRAGKRSFPQVRDVAGHGGLSGLQA